MRITVVGSGDAFNAAGRSNAAYWLDGAGDRPLMIDFGPTALRAVRERGRSPAELGGVAFTHLHGDHIGGYPFLHIDGMYHEPRAEPLRILGPIGARARLEALLRLCYPSIAEREPPFATEWTELAPGESAELCGARIEGFPAEHQDPPERPLCLRVTGRDGAVVAFSGDTAPCAGLLDAARGADLVVAECSGLRPPFGRHWTWVEWLEWLPRLEAGRVLLTHLGTSVRARIPELLTEAPAGVDLEFADDGLIVEL